MLLINSVEFVRLDNKLPVKRKKNKPIILALNYKAEILRVFQIDIASDREYSHPKHICSQCYRKNKNSKRSTAKTCSKAMVKSNLFWVRHHENCKVFVAFQNKGWRSIKYKPCVCQKYLNRISQIIFRALCVQKTLLL